jgi:uncharacterized protein
LLSSRAGDDAHDEAHLRAVAATGLELAAETPGADPHVVELFGLLHDARCVPRHGHGARAAELARQLEDDGLLGLGTDRLGTLCEALIRHSDGRVSDDPTIGVCWDADRLHLPRVGVIVNPKLLSTEAGRRRAVKAPRREHRRLKDGRQPSVPESAFFRFAWDPPAECMPNELGICTCVLRGWRFTQADGSSPYAGQEQLGDVVRLEGVPGERVVAPPGRGLYVAHAKAARSLIARTVLQRPGSRMFEITYDIGDVLTEGRYGRELTVSAFAVARELPADEIHAMATADDVRRLTRRDFDYRRRFGPPMTRWDLSPSLVHASP